MSNELELLARVEHVFGGAGAVDLRLAVLFEAIAPVPLMLRKAPLQQNVCLNLAANRDLETYVRDAVTAFLLQDNYANIAVIVPRRTGAGWYDLLARHACYLAQVHKEMRLSRKGCLFVGATGDTPRPATEDFTVALLSNDDALQTRFVRVMNKDNYARVEKVVK